MEDAGGEVAGPPVDADGGGRGGVVLGEVGLSLCRCLQFGESAAVWSEQRSLQQVSFAWNYMGDEAVGRLLQACCAELCALNVASS